MWTKHTEEIVECLNEFLKWNNTRNNRNVVEQIKCFAITESLMAESETENELPWIDVLKGQTRFTNIEGEIKEIGETD